MKKSIYSIMQHTDLKRKDIENGLFEAADLLMYAQPHFADSLPELIAAAIGDWMQENSRLLDALDTIRMSQLRKSGLGKDPLYLKIYKRSYGTNE